ncbi:MAG: hypothetical protein KAI91_00250 [Candidatus Omnitrophica bacterium]|nr:hypothetical protein [Candidatus Omnitrophota bacterium]
MEIKLLKKDSITINDQSLIDSNESNTRTNVIKSSNNFKNSWRDLAKNLYNVWQNKHYQDWGFKTFDDYVNNEVNIKKNTALKLIESYSFLKKETPPPNTETNTNNTKEENIPSLKAINLLQKAKKQLNYAEYSNLKEDVFTKEKDITEVKKDLTSLMKQRKEIDPEESRAKKNQNILKNFIKTLRNFKQDIEILKLLPENITVEIENFLNKIEAEVSNK